MTSRPKQHVKCHMQCNKGANHIISNNGRWHNFKPCDPDTARSKIANAFPGESDLPQPWVHPTLSKAYHCGETVLLVPPVCILCSDTDIVTICPAAIALQGITTCWLKHIAPDARRDRAERKQTESAFDRQPEPQVRLFLVFHLCGFNWCLGIVDVRV